MRPKYSHKVFARSLLCTVDTHGLERRSHAGCEDDEEDPQVVHHLTTKSQSHLTAVQPTGSKN
jgi:hypothetical protein